MGLGSPFFQIQLLHFKRHFDNFYRIIKKKVGFDRDLFASSQTWKKRTRFQRDLTWKTSTNKFSLSLTTLWIKFYLSLNKFLFWVWCMNYVLILVYFGFILYFFALLPELKIYCEISFSFVMRPNYAVINHNSIHQIKSFRWHINK